MDGGCSCNGGCKVEVKARTNETRANETMIKTTNHMVDDLKKTPPQP